MNKEYYNNICKFVDINDRVVEYGETIKIGNTLLPIIHCYPKEQDEFDKQRIKNDLYRIFKKYDSK